MNVHNAGVSFSNNATVFQELQYFKFGFKHICHRHHGVSMAEDDTPLNLVFVSHIYFNLNIVTWVSVFYLRICSVQNFKNLSRSTSGHDCQLVTQVKGSILDLTVNDDSRVLMLIKDW